MDARRRIRTVATALSALLLPRLALATVWTVSPPGGGGQFNDIQSAVNAASPGDTVLVVAGTYSPFVLDKALRVLGVDPGLVTVSVTAPGGIFPPPPPPAVVQVTGIPAGGFALLAGMRIEILTTYPTYAACLGPPSGWPSSAAVSVEGCAAPVVLSNLQLAPGHFFHGLTANLSTAVLLDHVSVAAVHPVSGTSGGFDTGVCVRAGIKASATNLSLNDSSVLAVVGSPALQLQGSSQSLVARTSLPGADGIDVGCGCCWWRGIDGGHGLLAANGATVRVAAGSPVTIRGGDGGYGFGGPGPFGFCCPAGGGGHAVISSAGTVLLAPGITLLPGLAGLGSSSASCPAFPGQSINGSGVFTAPAPLPSLGVSPALSSPGGTITLEVRGAPMSAFALGASGTPGFLPIPGSGPLLLDPAALVLVASGTLDATGTASISAAVPPDPLLSTGVLFLQPATLRA